MTPLDEPVVVRALTADRRGTGGHMQDAAVYRVKASDMRERAKSAHDPVAYEELLSLAEQYDAVARQAELLAATNLSLSRIN
jgi:hypothetical protein